MAASALVIEDEADIAQLVGLQLRDLGLEARCCDDGATGLARAANGAWDLIVLDLTLPSLDGIEICRRLRASGDRTPILMLTARDSELERAHGLETGADDYLGKPFGIVEFAARTRALLRRAGYAREASDLGAPPLRVDDLAIDVGRRRVLRDGAAIDLTAREFDLLLHLARQPGRVYSRAQLLDQVWGVTRDAFEHTVSSHINRLRTKLERDPHAPRYLVTVWGVGYRFGSG